MKNCFRIGLIILTVLAEHNDAARILALFPANTKSHFIMFKKVLMELANRGHVLDVISHFPLKEKIPRYNDISLAGTLPLYVNNISMLELQERGSTILKFLDWVFSDLGIGICKYAFQLKEFKDLLTTNKTYDLLITELYATDCMFVFGNFFQVPTVVLTSSADIPWGAERIGNPNNPSYISNYFLERSVPTTFADKAMNVVTYITSKFKYAMTISLMNQVVKDFFGLQVPHFTDIANNFSLVLLNSHPSFQSPRPMVPNVVEVGGVHIGIPKSLPKRIEQLMILPKSKGVVYVSLGSMFMLETFDVPKLRALLNAARELLDYTFLLKANPEGMPPQLPIPANVYCETWLPQLDVICKLPNECLDLHGCHNKTTLFITHGGLLGMQEGIYCGKPMIGIPMFADQSQNIHRGEMLGFMQMMRYETMDDETVLGTIRPMLQVRRFTDMAKRASELFKDRPQSAMDTAMFWIEYVIRNDQWHRNGHPEIVQRPLRSPAADMGWYQYYLIDVICVVVITFIILLYLIVAIIQYLYRKVVVRGETCVSKVKSN